ncbi:MAG: hypothetical protein ACJ75I_09070 [Solirubrobacterales bacterium]
MSGFVIGRGRTPRRLLAVGLSAGVVLAALSAGPAQAAFPGRNGKIAFARFPRSSSPFEEIYTVSPTGSGLNRVTNSGGGPISNVFPDWNAAGTRIAFVHSTSSGDRIQISTPSGNVVDSFGDPRCLGLNSPGWSPNGTTIAYSCVTNGGDNASIKTYDVGTQRRIPITARTGYDSEPEFSPGGHAIAFTRELGNGASSQVVVAGVNQNGNPTSEEVVAGSLNESAYAPDWSPNANRLAYACIRLKPSVGDNDICVAPVSAPHTQSKLVNSPSEDVFPAFAPSGGKIVWQVGDPQRGDTELKVKNLSTGNVVTITSDPVVDEEPDWGVG